MFENATCTYMYIYNMQTKVPFWDKVYVLKVLFLWPALCPFSKLWEML